MSNPKSLTDDQVSRIREWADAGDGVPEIQKKLREEFDLRVTYLDTRFSSRRPEDRTEADSGARAREKPAPRKRMRRAWKTRSTTPRTVPMEGAGVTLTVDTVLRPGAIISGKADFGGGQTASWWLDQMGRLGLDTPDPSFRPPRSRPSLSRGIAHGDPEKRL